MSLLTLTGFTDLKTDKDKNLIYDIWHLLKGDEHQGIIFRNIYVFLLSVLGLYFPWMNEESEIKVQELSNLNCILEETKEEEIFSSELENPSNSIFFKVTKGDSKNLHNYFIDLYFNKISFESSLNQIKSNSKNNQNIDFNPSINQNSKRLANNFVSKTLNNISNSVGKNVYSKVKHHDFLLIKGLEYERKNLEKQKQAAIENDSEISKLSKIELQTAEVENKFKTYGEIYKNSNNKGNQVAISTKRSNIPSRKNSRNHSHVKLRNIDKSMNKLREKAFTKKIEIKSSKK